MAYIPKKPKKKTTERGYGHKHQVTRKELLHKFPICQLCNERWSWAMHHIDLDPHNRDPLNLLALCCRCHGDIHYPAD